MARLRYASRTDGIHDRRWVDALRFGGHVVEVVDAARVGQPGAVDLVVAGPLSDVTPAAVAAGVAPVLGVAWAFDVLLEAQDPTVRARMEAALPRCVGVHVDCGAIRSEVVALGADPRLVSMAAWGIDTDFFAPGPAPAGLRRTYGLGADDVVVFSDRAWEPGYNIPVVVTAIADAAATDPRIRLVLAGSGSMEETVRALIDDLGFADRVVLTGRLDQSGLLGWLHTADVYVSASASDGTSLSLLEAMACGVRAVVPDVGGNPEWVAGPLEGRLFPVGDAVALGGAVRTVLADSDGPRRRQARRDRVLDRGHWPDNRTRILHAVDRALSARAPGR